MKWTGNGAIFTASYRGGEAAMEAELWALGIETRHSRPYHPKPSQGHRQVEPDVVPDLSTAAADRMPPSEMYDVVYEPDEHLPR